MTNTVDIDGGWTFRAEDTESVTHTVTFGLAGAPALTSPFGRIPFRPDIATVLVGLHPQAEDSGHLAAIHIEMTGYRVRKDGSASALRTTDGKWWLRAGDKYTYDDTDPAYIHAVAAHAVETVKAMLR